MKKRIIYYVCGHVCDAEYCFGDPYRRSPWDHAVWAGDACLGRDFAQAQETLERTDARCPDCERDRD